MRECDTYLEGEECQRAVGQDVEGGVCSLVEGDDLHVAAEQRVDSDDGDQL